MNLTRQRAEEVFDKVLKYSTADETEATISSTSYALTRFANNIIHQNVAEETTSLSVRLVSDGRMARASTNKFDETSIRQLCEDALILARLQPSVPDLLPMPGPQTYRALDRFFVETAQLTPQTRAEMVAKVVERAEKDGLTAAGVFSSGASAYGLFNSRGLKAYHEETMSEFSVTMMSDSSSGWAKKTAPYWMELEPPELAERAAQKALASREPREIEPGRYTVILEPSAMLDLMGFMILDFSGMAVHEQRSCLTGRVDKKVFADNINLRDDVFHPLQTGAPFDGEGVPTRRTVVFQNGVLKTHLFDTYYARKLGAKSTGNASGNGVGPNNFYLEPGNVGLEELIGQTKRGLLVLSIIGFATECASGTYSRGISGVLQGVSPYPWNVRPA